VLDTYAREGAAADVVVIACFGDPGLFALRELANVPVIGMAEASCHMAATLGRKFAIVTGGQAWGPMLEEFVAAIGLSNNLAGVRTVAPTGADIAADPDKALGSLKEVCHAAIDQDGADAIILGGLGLAGLAERIAADVPVPLIDNVVAAVRMAEAAATLGVSKAKSGSFSAGEPVKTLGLSAQLAALLEGRGAS
jgi:Asp/Glu/hydantoin racemase